MEVTEETANKYKEDYDTEIWTGKISSADCPIMIDEEKLEGCAQCHSKKDYHHRNDLECSTCHVGQVGDVDFGPNHEGCKQCHRRPHEFGRRNILGKEGDFSQPSVHIKGEITEQLCLECHDQTHHKSGKVNLAGIDKPFKDAGVKFCLTCHSSRSQNENTDGTGYDKSAFPESTHAKWLGPIACSHCHNSHGSPNHSLLKARYVIKQYNKDGDTIEDYQLCWNCHDNDRLLRQPNGNVFGRLHSKHVRSKGLSCINCHDVHGAFEKHEPGLIKFVGENNSEDSFRIDEASDKGICVVECHQNKPQSYTRGKKRHTVSCLNCH